MRKKPVLAVHIMNECMSMKCSNRETEKTKSRLVVARGWGREKGENRGAITEYSFGVEKMS